MPELPPLLVIACGALVREFQAVVDANDLTNVALECLPAALHNRPELIAAEVGRRIDRAGAGTRILIGYAECGTGGELDRLIEAENTAGRDIERLPGAHCYEFLATAPRFAALHEAEPGTFYLTDYLARHFDLLVVRWLGLDRHPELRDAYFGNYRRLVYLGQSPDETLVAAARAAAAKLGLAFEQIPVGYGDLEGSLVDLAERKAG